MLNIFLGKTCLLLITNIELAKINISIIKTWENFLNNGFFSDNYNILSD